MSWYRASLQTLGAIVLLALVLACHGKGGGSSSSATGTITGTVTYLRVPLVKDAQGKPTGLADASVAANLQSLPARGIHIRIYQQIPQTTPSGNTINVWVHAQSATTDSTGIYSAGNLVLGRATMVELTSSFDGGGAITIQLIAEPQGINSPAAAPDRMQYALRKAADGTAPANNNAPSSVLSANTVVNFSVGLNDEWWVYDPAKNPSTGESPFVGQAKLETDPTLVAGPGAGRIPGLGAGSRVLGIGDTIASFVTTYSTATPGNALDLHYWPGLDSGGSYVAYNRSAFPISLTSRSYFGTLRGGPSNDDAWDEGVILPLLARNTLFGGNLARTFGVPLNPIYPPGAPLADLSPDMARIEGLVQAMAANVLKSPYLADTQGTGLAAPLVDIRDISGLGPSQLGPLAAPAIQAFAWAVILKANSLPSPGLAADWATINPLAAARFFLAPAGLTGISANGVARDGEPLNIFNQINRLKETKIAAEPFDLLAIFTDPVLTSLGTPYGISWPRPTSGSFASFIADWGTDPTAAFPPVVLSMAKAVQVNGTYPNVSVGELFYAGFNLSVDKRCTLTAVIAPALGNGAGIDVDLPMLPRTFTFTGSGGTTAGIVIPVNNAAPTYHPVRIHLNSPGVLQPDTTLTLILTPTP